MEKNKKWGYAIGNLGILLPFNLVVSFAYTFWVYVIGLDALIVGASFGISTLIFGVTSPIFGFLSDNKKYSKRWGRRKVFFLYGLLPFAITSILMFISPEINSSYGATNVKLGWYLFILSILFYLSYSSMRTPYFSILAEITDDEQERVQISGIHGIFFIISIFLALFIPMLLMGEIDNPADIYGSLKSRDYLVKITPIIALIITIVAIILIIISFFSVDEKPLITDQTSEIENPSKKGISQLFSDLFQCLKDSDFMLSSLASFFVNITFVVFLNIIFPVAAIVIELKGIQFTLFTIFTLPFAALGFLYWQKMAKISLKKTFVVSMLHSSIGLFLTLLLLIPMSRMLKIILSFIIIAYVLFCITSNLFISMPIISKCVDNQNKDSKTEKNLSGLYFGAFFLIMNISNFAGNFFNGLFFSGTRSSDPFYLTIIFPIIGIFCLISVPIFKKSKID